MEYDLGDFNVFKEYAAYLIKNSFINSVAGYGYSVYSIGEDLNES